MQCEAKRSVAGHWLTVVTVTRLPPTRSTTARGLMVRGPVVTFRRPVAVVTATAILRTAMMAARAGFTGARTKVVD